MRSSPASPPSRRRFLAHLGGTAALVSLAGLRSRAESSSSVTSTDTSSDPLYASATKLAELIRTKKLSSVEAVQAQLARIAAVNPKINAVVTLVTERALAEAAAADAALARGRSLGPLHGVPFTIKDSLETAGVISTAGTLGRKGHVPGTDATAVARVRAAGAILIGKTNTPEFTLGGGGLGTYNLVFGQTYNPYKAGYSPSGSSGGAGAIVAAGGSSFDIGSDFGGSIRGPAHMNGIAGIKPTTGRVPRTGHLPGYGGPFDSYQQLGPLARRVEDLELILSLIAGPDFEDPVILPIPLGASSAVSLKGLRVAFYTSNAVSTPTAETIAAVKNAAQALAPAVASVTEAFHGGDAEGQEIRSAYVGADGGAWFQRMLDEAGTRTASPGIVRRITGKTLAADQFTRLAERQDALRSRLLSWMDSYDVILCPTGATPATALDRPETPGAPVGGGYTQIYNITGWPAAVLRGGMSPDGLPIGVQIVGKPWRDDVVLAVARHLEAQPGFGYRPPVL